MSAPADSGKTRAPVVLVVGLIAVGVNLRPALASVGPVLADIRAGLGLSGLLAGLLITAPVLCFSVLSPVAPGLGRRFGLERTLEATLVGLLAGLVLRTGGGVTTLFAGTMLAGGSIAIANVLLPALVKRDFPDRVGLLTGVYSTALGGAAALASGLTVPIGSMLGAGWRGALGSWAALAGLGAIGWLPQLRRRSPPTAFAAAPAAGTGKLLHSGLAWQVTAFFGLQSLNFYAVLAWLPSRYVDAGYSPGAAGGLLSVVTIVGMPVALVVPALAARASSQRAVAVGATAFTAAGLTGLLAAPTAAPLAWVVLIGLGQGAAFPLALTLVALRSRSAEVTAQLSAMVQALGYLLAATGPLAVGALHDAARSWTPAVGLLLVLTVPQALAGAGAGRSGYVESDLPLDTATGRSPTP